MEITEESANAPRRNLKELSLDCDLKLHFLFQYLISLPMIAFIIIFLPGVVIFKLIRAKREHILYDNKIINKYGFFYLPYRKRRFYYEFVVFARKVCFLLIQNALIFALIGKYLKVINIIFAYIGYLFFFYTILRSFKPYDQKRYNPIFQMEKLSFSILMVCGFAAGVWFTQYDEKNYNSASYLLAFVEIAIASLLNFIFFILWGYRYFLLSKRKIFGNFSIILKIY